MGPVKEELERIQSRGSDRSLGHRSMHLPNRGTPSPAQISPTEPPAPTLTLRPCIALGLGQQQAAQRAQEQQGPHGHRQGLHRLESSRWTDGLPRTGPAPGTPFPPRRSEGPGPGLLGPAARPRPFLEGVSAPQGGWTASTLDWKWVLLGGGKGRGRSRMMAPVG